MFGDKGLKLGIDSKSTKGDLVRLRVLNLDYSDDCTKYALMEFKL